MRFFSVSTIVIVCFLSLKFLSPVSNPQLTRLKELVNSQDLNPRELREQVSQDLQGYLSHRHQLADQIDVYLALGGLAWEETDELEEEYTDSFFEARSQSPPSGSERLYEVEVIGPLANWMSKQKEKNSKKRRTQKKVSIRLWAAGLYARGVVWLRAGVSYIDQYLLGFSVLIFLGGLLHRFVPKMSFGSLFARKTYNISRRLIEIISLSAIFAALVFGRNLWQDAGNNLLLGLCALLVASCGALKCSDFNFPIWNRSLMSLSLLTISLVIIHAGSFL